MLHLETGTVDNYFASPEASAGDFILPIESLSPDDASWDTKEFNILPKLGREEAGSDSDPMLSDQENSLEFSMFSFPPSAVIVNDEHPLAQRLLNKTLNSIKQPESPQSWDSTGSRTFLVSANAQEFAPAGNLEYTPPSEIVEQKEFGCTGLQDASRQYAWALKNNNSSSSSSSGPQGIWLVPTLKDKNGSPAPSLQSSNPQSMKTVVEYTDSEEIMFPTSASQMPFDNSMGDTTQETLNAVWLGELFGDHTSVDNLDPQEISEDMKDEGLKSFSVATFENQVDCQKVEPARPRRIRVPITKSTLSDSEEEEDFTPRPTKKGRSGVKGRRQLKTPSSDSLLDYNPSERRTTAFTARGRKVNRLQLSEEDHSDDFGESGNRRSKHHNPWTVEETEALVMGVERCGGGKWADIKKMGLRAIEKRSPVDLKDKWRNLQAALHRPKSDKKREIPASLLMRVKLLVPLTATKARAEARPTSARKHNRLKDRSR